MYPSDIIISGHDDRAWHVSWNPAKPLLATCSADKSVRLYAYTSGPSPSFSLYTSISTGHTKTVRSTAWSPSGSTLATASFDANIGIWKREGQDEDDQEAAGDWECVSLLEGHETECKCVAWSGSGTLLASCSRDKTVWVWEGAWLHVLRRPRCSPTSQSNRTLTLSAWGSSWNILRMSSALPGTRGRRSIIFRISP